MCRFPLLVPVLLAYAVAPAAQVEVSVATDRATYTTVDTVLVAITARNTTSGSVTLQFGSGREAAFDVNGAMGLYCAFTQMQTERTLGPGESYTWEGLGRDRPRRRPGCYDYVLNQSNPPRFPTPNLGPGTYQVVGYVGDGTGPYPRYGQAAATFTVIEATPNEPGPALAGYATGAVYPNPAQAGASLPLRVPSAQAVHVRILDVLGREVLVADVQADAGENLIRLDVGELPPGAYIVSVVAGAYAAGSRLAVVR